MSATISMTSMTAFARGLGLIATLAASGCDQAPSEDGGELVSETVPSPPWFTDEAQARGLAFSHVSGATGDFLLPEIMGSGAALFDADGDGDLDAYLVQSGRFPGRTDGTPGNELYINDGTGRFVRVRATGAEDQGYGMGVTAGDYDNDGDVDLYVTNVGTNALLANDGAGTFTDVTQVAGVQGQGFSTAAVFFDADRDGDLDLFVVNYVAWHRGVERECFDYGTGVRNYCDPGNYQLPDRDILYRNDGDGTFTDVSGPAGLTAASGNGLGVVSADFDGNGLPDIFVANDKTMNHLWLNQGEMTFRDDAVLWGCAMDDHGITKAGMGVVAEDVDNDGDPDLLVVNIEGETDSYYRNEGSYFVDATAVRGLGTVSRRYTRFGVALADFNNDGLLDLYEANGRVTWSPEPEAEDVFAEPNVLMQGTADQFAVVSPGGGVEGTLVHTSRGVAIGDVDDDGGLDLLVVNRDAPAYLLMNRAPSRGHWARVETLARNGRAERGAVVSGLVNGERRFRRAQAAGSYLAAHDMRIHFGLGGADRLVDVQVRWPSGQLEAFGDIPAGETSILREGGGIED